ncbi:ATP-binding cassette domain-containing protein [Lactobacillus sp. LL6]|uniref:ATP-binding cassette domain-containing protein n=1 Tax=Lactobacillus sp. LL6 TaxID=2596827 RepID=UPI001186D69A|nr:ATP-binding cassette domain-containing protein [Lactobacillus sp. LL6]TSO25606.1 ATP-binding cassette domain-containing protein [Lactobacillus sp. LL6]
MQLELHDLSFSYKNTIVWSNLNDTFLPGKVNYLIGYNGAGKSTMFDLISGIVEPTNGNITGLPAKQEILYQTQNPVIFGALTGRDLRNFIFGVSQGYNKIEISKLSPHFRDLYTRLLNRKLGNMSVGERRWLLLFFESRLHKKLFLLDEPLAGVDPVSKIQIEKTIGELAKDKEKLVIVTTHELSHMNQENCYIHLLNNGKISFFESYQDFVSVSPTQNPEEAFVKLTCTE